MKSNIKYNTKRFLLFLLLCISVGLQGQPYAYVACTNTNVVKKVNTNSGFFGIVTTINVGNTPHGVAVTPDGTKVYVTNSLSNTVSVISTATDMVTATINVGSYPYGIIASPDGSVIYVGNNGTNTISVIDVATDVVIRTITVGTGPYGLALSPDGVFLYATNQFDNTVSMVLADATAAYATINVGSSPKGLVSSHDGKTLFVVNESSDNVSVIDVTSGTVSSTFSVGNSPHDIDIISNGAWLLVANTGSSNVTMYNINTYALTKTFSMPTAKGVSALPNSLDFVVFSSLSSTIRLYNIGLNSVQGSANLGSTAYPAGLGNFVYTPAPKPIEVLFPIYKGGNGQGYAADLIENTQSLFAGGNGQGYAADYVENTQSLFAGGNGQGYAADYVENTQSLFAGGNGQGYAMEEISSLVWTGTINTNWLEPSNWSTNTIPTIGKGVKILDGAPNYPVLTTGILGIKEDNAVDYTCKNIFIDNNASLSLGIGTQILNKGIIQIQGNLNHNSNLDNAFYNSDGAKIIIKSAGTLRIYDNTLKHDLPDLILDNATLMIDTGTVEIADVLEVKNGGKIEANTATLTVKKVGKGSDKEGFLIDASSEMILKGTINSGGQNPTSTKKAIDWANAAMINADSATIKFVQPTANSAALANGIDVDFGGKKVFQIQGASSGYIYPHFQDDVEVLGNITIGSNDIFYQDNGTITANRNLSGAGEFIGTNGFFKFAGIDFCDVDIRHEFDGLIIQKSNGASVTVLNFPLKVKKDLEVISGTLSVNPMITKPDLDIDRDFKIQNGGIVELFGYQMEVNVGGDYLNYNTQPSMGGFQNNGFEGKFTFDGSGSHDICAGNTSMWGDTVQFVNGGVYNMKSQMDLTNSILSILGGKIAVDNDTMLLNPFSLNNQYGANNYIITDGTGAVKINDIGNGDTLNIPIGVDANQYTPIRIINNGTIDDFFVSAKKGVKTGGTTGQEVTNDIVGVTWEIEEKNAGGSDVELIFRWTAADEKVGFNRNNAKVWHYKNGQWIQENSDAVQGSDPYFMSLKNISTFSPFAVANQDAALPVECLTFEAIETNQGILLTWTTETETNNDRFELERSINGVDFERIATIQGNGTTINRSGYEYQDVTTLTTATYYYRLKQIDLDGNFEYACEVISIETNRGKVTKIGTPFPNPTKAISTLVITIPTQQNIDIQLVNLKGQIVSQQQTTLQAGTQNLSIDLTKLPAGAYQLRIQLEGKERIVEKIIKL